MGHGQVEGEVEVDRLSLWIGQLSSPGASGDLFGFRQTSNLNHLVIEGDYSEVSEHRRPPRKGEYVTFLDAALVESGLAHRISQKRSLTTIQDITWSIQMGEDLKFITLGQ